MTYKKRIVFTFNVDNVIDIITNSSSELFVFENEVAETIKEMVSMVYPDYLNEYQELKLLKDCDKNNLEIYINQKYQGWSNKQQKSLTEVIPGFTWHEMYEKHEYGSYMKDDFVEMNKEKLIKTLDPENKIWLLFSLDENPNWDYQEKLSTFGERHHLG